ncbi:MAG: phosphoribosyltransferase [Sulfurovaceae bacterium]|nr:phosphoribosyltransferase [Sulfurovaceae bacterium]
MLKNRKDAGEKLALALQKYKIDNALVLAIPRGGTELGYEIAKAFGYDLSLIICRKLPYPYNPESGFGAIAEDGSIFIDQRAAYNLDDQEIEQIIADQSEEIQRRIKTLRNGKPLPSIKGRTVILVDDGIAMGSTMHVAVALCKKQEAKKIIIAVPVAGASAIAKFSPLVDELVVLESPYNFHAVAQVYEDWYDVSDEEVLEILSRIK